MNPEAKRKLARELATLQRQHADFRKNNQHARAKYCLGMYEGIKRAIEVGYDFTTMHETVKLAAAIQRGEEA